MKSNNRKRDELFESYPIPKAIATLALPTVISQLITIVYNLADTYFVGQLNDPYQVSAINVCLPLMLVCTSIANLFGVGGSGVIARALGKKDIPLARRVSSFCIYAGLATTALCSAVIFIFREPVLTLLGADEMTYAHSNEYFICALAIGGCATMLNPLLAHLVRSEGGALHASIGMSLGAIMNIVLDPIFILLLGFEVKGAAIATLIGNVSACVYFFVYIFIKRRDSIITFIPKRISRSDVLDVLWTGVPSFFISLLSGISNSVVNNLISARDSIALASVGIAKKINLTAFAIVQGLSQGCLPLIGYNYSHGNKKRVADTVKVAGVIGACVSLSCMGVALLFPDALVSLFIKHEQTVEYGSTFLRIICPSMPTSTFIFMCVTYFQATGEKAYPLIISLLRKGTVDVLLMYALDSTIGINGVLLATPLTEVIASLTCGVMIILLLKKKRKELS